MDDDKPAVEIIKLEKETVSPEVYEDLLNRYEKVLVYAGQLQEKNRQQLLLQEKSGGVEKENERLRRLVAIDQSYVRLLEKALSSLGLMRADDEDLR